LGARPQEALRIECEGLGRALGQTLLGAEEAERRAAFTEPGGVGEPGGDGGSCGEQRESRSREKAKKDPAQGRMAQRRKTHEEIAPSLQGRIYSAMPPDPGRENRGSEIAGAVRGPAASCSQRRRSPLSSCSAHRGGRFQGEMASCPT